MKKIKIYIRSSSHTIKFANSGKLDTYHDFIQEYRKVAQIYINFIWDNEYKYTDKNDNVRIFNTKNDELDAPSFFDYNLIPIPFETKLSARSLSSLVTQCCGAISAATSVRKKLLYKKSKMIEYNEHITEKFLELIEETKLIKPNALKINPELSSKNIDFEETNGHFNLFIRLKCLGEFDSICIPIKLHKQANKWKNFCKNSERKGSILLTNRNIQIRWEFEKEIKTKGIIVGADQGKLTVLSLSDKQTTTKCDCHGHSLDSIMKKLSNKEKGKRAFRKAQDHRKNFINWSLNNLDFNNIQRINFEEIRNLRKGKKTNRVMSHFSYPLIERKTNSLCEETGVQFVLQPSAFRSQRCSECGWVHSSNRNKKVFKCMICGEALDADINASINHEIELSIMPEWMMKSGINRTSGFYWKPEGIFTKEGEEYRVPLSNNQEINIL